METLTRADVEILERRTGFRRYFRVDIWRLRHRLFAGGWSPGFEREVFERGHAVGLLPYDPVRDEVVLVRQFRAGALAADCPPWIVEPVAGIIEDGEAPEDVARREAMEEARLEVAALRFIARYLPSPGGCSETCRLYCGRVDASGAEGIAGLASEHEDIRIERYAARDAIALADDPAQIHSSVTLIALNWLARHRESLREAWLREALPEASAGG